jgi:hypothetical protein
MSFHKLVTISTTVGTISLLYTEDIYIVTDPTSLISMQQRSLGTFSYIYTKLSLGVLERITSPAHEPSLVSRPGMTSSLSHAVGVIPLHTDHEPTQKNGTTTTLVQ